MLSNSNKNETMKITNNNKILKNINMQIIEKQEAKEDIKNVDHVLSNEGNGGAFFSISMTVYSQQSLVPNNMYDFLPKDTIKDFNKFNSNLKIEEAVFEQEYSPLLKNYNGNSLKQFEFNNLETSKDQLNESTDSIKKLIDIYNLNEVDFKQLDPIEKLKTLEIKYDDLQKLEAFFKDRNNKKSIDPIEKDAFFKFIEKENKNN
jgi:hypothetical protein